MAKLNEKQIAAIEYLAMPKLGGKSYEQVAEEVGVSDRTLRNWRNDDDFVRELNRRIIRNTQSRMPEVFDAAIDGIIDDKNAALFRTFVQLHGLLTEKHEIDAKGNGDVDTGAMKAEIEAFRQRMAGEGKGAQDSADTGDDDA